MTAEKKPTRLLLTVLFSAALLVGPSCDTSTAPVDDDVFVELMVELHLVDMRRVPDVERATLRSRVLDKYDVSNAELVDTISFYAENTEAYAEVYTRIVDRLREESNAEL